jgi:hypothetical protein
MRIEEKDTTMNQDTQLKLDCVPEFLCCITAYVCLSTFVSFKLNNPGTFTWYT